MDFEENQSNSFYISLDGKDLFPTIIVFSSDFWVRIRSSHPTVLLLGVAMKIQIREKTIVDGYTKQNIYLS
jgi:hypothetical protein